MVGAISAACFAAGHILAGMWTQELIEVLAQAGVEIALTSPLALGRSLLWTALSFAFCGPLAALGVLLVARVAGQPLRLGPYLRATAVLFIGANLGIAAKAITLARLSVPAVVEQNPLGGPLMLDVSELSLAPAALGGVVLAVILYASVAGVVAMLGRSR